MKLVKEIKQLALVEGIKVGDYIELEDTMSCNKFQCKVEEITTKSIKVRRISNGQTLVFGLEELSNYEAKKLKLVYAEDESILSQAAKNTPSKKECEKATDDYEDRLIEAFNQVFGSGVKVNKCNMWD